MKLSALKKVRLARMMTQIAVAEAMGISQPNYQRWESGAAAIPKTKQAQLAKVLNSTVDEILGNPRAFDNLGIYENIGDEDSYFGEIAFHFASGKGLLFPITEAERSRLYHRLSDQGDFIVVESLDNRIAFIRRAAIHDVFFSSEAFGTFGPEKYEDWLGGYRFEDDAWLLIENVEDIDYMVDVIGEEKVKIYEQEIYLTEEKLDELITQGHVEKEDKEEIKSKESEKIGKLYMRATHIQWQFANGKVRSEYIIEDKDVYEAFSCLEIDPTNAEPLLHLSVEEYDRSIFINTSELDYIFIPAHKFHYGHLKTLEEELGE